MSRSDLRDIDVVFVHETVGAICVKADEGSAPRWLPKSLCEYEGAHKWGGVGVLTAPEGLLIEKDLV